MSRIKISRPGGLFKRRNKLGKEGRRGKVASPITPSESTPIVQKRASSDRRLQSSVRRLQPFTPTSVTTLSGSIYHNLTPTINNEATVIIVPNYITPVHESTTQATIISSIPTQLVQKLGERKKFLESSAK